MGPQCGENSADGQCRRGRKLQMGSGAVRKDKRGVQLLERSGKEWGFMETELSEEAQESDRGGGPQCVGW